jgi:hypothetical protein
VATVSNGSIANLRIVNGDGAPAGRYGLVPVGALPNFYPRKRHDLNAEEAS